jgi:hypothetical protein
LDKTQKSNDIEIKDIFSDTSKIIFILKKENKKEIENKVLNEKSKNLNKKEELQIQQKQNINKFDNKKKG